MDERVTKLLNKKSYIDQADELEALLYEQEPPEGLDGALAKLLDVKIPDVRSAVLRGYAQFYPALAIDVLVEQLGRVTHTGMLDSIGQLVADHAASLRSVPHSVLDDALANALTNAPSPRLRSVYRRAFANVAAPERAVEVLVAEKANETDVGSRLQIDELFVELERADLVLESLPTLEDALTSNDEMTRGCALELIAKLGTSAEPLLVGLHGLARRKPKAYGLAAALTAVQGSTDVPEVSAGLDADRVRKLASGKPSHDAWGELSHLLRSAPEDVDAARWLDELEPMLADWKDEYRTIGGVDLVSPDRWAPLYRTVVAVERGWTAKEVAAFVSASVYPRMASLVLDGNPIGDAGIDAIVDAPWISELERLSLAQCRITAEGARTLAARPPPALTALDLRYNEVGREGADALASSSMRLGQLLLEGSGVPAAAATSLGSIMKDVRGLSIDES